MFIEDYGWEMAGQIRGQSIKIDRLYAFFIEEILDKAAKQDMTFMDFWHHGEYQMWGYQNGEGATWSTHKFSETTSHKSHQTVECGDREAAFEQLKRWGKDRECL
jgi:hypothetical protein